MRLVVPLEGERQAAVLEQRQEPTTPLRDIVLELIDLGLEKKKEQARQREAAA